MLFFGSSYAPGGSIPSMAALVGRDGIETGGFVVGLALFGAGVAVLGRPGATVDEAVAD